jgi:hypothetical protein
MRKRGLENKYDKFSGDWMEWQKTRGPSPGVSLPFRKRFCESCQSKKPSNSAPAVKGWRCDDCMAKAEKKEKGT